MRPLAATRSCSLSDLPWHSKEARRTGIDIPNALVDCV
jgi:hypothetical protein